MTCGKAADVRDCLAIFLAICMAAVRRLSRRWYMHAKGYIELTRIRNFKGVSLLLAAGPQ